MAAPNTIACYAKLVGPSHTVFYLTRPRATLGRKVTYPEGTLYESGEKVPIADFFVGSSPSISRIHCKVAFNVGGGRELSHYDVVCCSKNGMWVDGVHITRDTGPYPLRSRSLLLLGDAYWYFLLPRDAKLSDGLARPPAVTYVAVPLITRSSRLDEEQREREREQRRRKEREERERLRPSTASTSPAPTSHSPTPTSRPPLPPPDPWSRPDREAMKDALLTFTCARTDLLQRYLRLQGVRKPDAAVDSFTATFIAALMSNAGGTIAKQLRQLSPAAHALLTASTSSAGPRAPPPPLLLTLLTWNVMTKNNDGWARRLLQLHSLHLQMITRGSLHILDDLPQSPRGRLPAVWWSRECDVDLLLGIYKWGYRRFDEMRDDRELCFHRIMGQLREKKVQPSDASPASAADADALVEEAEEGEEDGGDDYNSDEEEEADEDDEGGEDDERPKKKAKSSSSSTPAASRPASPIGRTLFGPVSKGKTEDGWPISLALVGRFRQLLKVMRLRDASEAADSAKRRAGDPLGPPRAPKRHRRELVPGWADDELSLFHKLLLLVGAPLVPPVSGSRWAHLRAEVPAQGQAAALLKRGDEALTARLEAVQKEARALLLPLNEAQLLTGLHDRTLGLVTSLYNGPLAANLPAVLTPLVASHLLSHLQYFQQSRTALATPPTTTPPAPPASPVAPAWWKQGLHDRYLVQAINAHGLRLKEIDEDLVYPFKMYGGLEGHLRAVGVGKGMEWIVERWKALVDFWVAEKEREAKGASGQTGSGGAATGRGKEEARKKDGRRSGGSQQSQSSSRSDKSHR